MNAKWNTFYTGAKAEVDAAIQQIDSNCGFPDDDCQTWARSQQAYQKNFWFIPMPPPEGYVQPKRKFSQQEMIAGIVSVQQQQSDPSWWEPLNPPNQVGK